MGLCRERPMCRSVSVGRYLLTYKYRQYVGAEIPPAGAPAGFDSAATFDFIA